MDIILPNIGKIAAEKTGLTQKRAFFYRINTAFCVM
jgi:hypothetical protein